MGGTVTRCLAAQNGAVVKRNLDFYKVRVIGYSVFYWREIDESDAVFAVVPNGLKIFVA